MKKRIIVLLLITTCFLMVFSVNLVKILQIHHNSTTTTIPLADVINITHSMYGTDSVLHDNYKTTVVATADTVYSFPIEDIDSVTINETMVTLEEVSPILEDNEFAIRGKIWGFDSNNSSKYRCDLIIHEGTYVISSLNANSPLNERYNYLIKGNDGSIVFNLPLLDDDCLGFRFKLSTVYGFTLAVEYEGEWYYSQTRFCSWNLCPNDHHPHYIDLNLPSGTKWRCCNAGAQTPGQYGDFYAFGELYPKSSYTRDNYLHLVELPVGPGTYDSDLSWPDHDPSFMKGSNFTEGMPSTEQVIELNVYTEKHTYVLNGVNGLLVQGSNGGLIFLPAGGQMRESLGDLGVRGHFWAYQLSPVGLAPFKWTWQTGYHFEEGKAVSTSPQLATDDFFVGKDIRPVLTYYGYQQP